MSDPSPPPGAQARRQWALFAVLWLVIGALLALALWAEHQQGEARERERLRQSAAIVHDNIARQLRSIHAVLARLAEAPLPPARAGIERERASDRLHAFGEAMTGVRTLNLLDAMGTIVASNREELVGQNFAYRDYFLTAHSAAPDALLVSAPFRAVLGGWYITLARRVTLEGGGFGGVVMATLDPEQFLTLLQSVRYAPDMVAGLVHGDGLRFLMAFEGQSQPVEADVARADTPFALHMHSGAPASVLQGRMAPDGPLLQAAVRTISPPELHMDKPLVVGVARRQEAVFDEWRAAAWVVAVAYALLGMGAGTALLVLQWRRRDLQEHALALAEREAVLEARWRAVLEATSLGVWEWRGEGGPVYFSPAWKAMLGYEDGDVADGDHDWTARLHPDERRQVLAQLDGHLQGHTPFYELTHRIRRKDGSWRWVQARGRVLERDAEGRPLHFVGTYGDVGEQGQRQVQLDLLAESVPGMLYQYQRDPDGHSHFPYVSAGALDIYGLTPRELRADARPAVERIHPEDALRVQEGVDRSGESLEVWRDEYRLLLPGRGERWLSALARPQRLEGGALLWHGYIQDVTEAKRQALQLQETERLLQHLMHEMPIGLALVDGAGHMYFRNRRFLEYFGYDDSELSTLEQWWSLVYPDPGYRAEVVARWSAALAQATHQGGDITPEEYRTTSRDGTERVMAVGGLVFGGHFLATFQDRTEELAQSDLLRRLAYMDSLTGVANRRHFDQTLEAEWRRCRRSGQPLSLILLDIDHFKEFNDLYGHQAGDACLKAVAATLRAGLARSHDLVARYGGEEFACLLPECDLAGATAKAEALREAVQARALEHDGSGTARVVTVSAGVACLVPDGAHGPQELVAQADAQLYRAKAAGRNRVHNGSGMLS
ncbi:diguanylate cyclase [Melaminivora sp.]|uniref:diguanylate cyclase n=1 Tax=Melaminivora sp. TaxID=1933032 RepID=UPI0028AFB630|nr:diguanylate cyclase [Melaminivora sp.]